MLSSPVSLDLLVLWLRVAHREEMECAMSVDVGVKVFESTVTRMGKAALEREVSKRLKSIRCPDHGRAVNVRKNMTGDIEWVVPPCCQKLVDQVDRLLRK